MRAAVWAALLAVTSLGGCRSKPAPEKAAPAPSSVASAAEKRIVPRLEPPADVPTEEDFEIEAARQITTQNLEQELDRLEKELQSR